MTVTRYYIGALNDTCGTPEVPGVLGTKQVHTLVMLIDVSGALCFPLRRQFLPDSGDQVTVALKSMENEEESTQDSFLMVLSLDGKVLLDETRVRKPGRVIGVVRVDDSFNVKSAGEREDSVEGERV